MVTRNKDRMGGSPSINNRRISVYNLVSGLEHEEFPEDYLEDFEITKPDALDAIHYCSNLKCNENLDLRFCEGCLLDTLYAKNNDLRSIKWRKAENGMWTSEDGRIVYLDDPSSIEDEFFGRPGWAIADFVLKSKF